MRVREIMTADPRFVVPQDPIARAAEIMRELDVGIVPVVTNATERRIEGVITDRDITVRCVADRHAPGCRVADHMTSDHLATVGPDAHVSEAENRMRAGRVRRILVAEGGRLVGIVAQADLATKLGPTSPVEVERVLEFISEPAHAPA